MFNLWTVGVWESGEKRLGPPVAGAPVQVPVKAIFDQEKMIPNDLDTSVSTGNSFLPLFAISICIATHRKIWSLSLSVSMRSALIADQSIAVSRTVGRPIKRILFHNLDTIPLIDIEWLPQRLRPLRFSQNSLLQARPMLRV